MFVSLVVDCGHFEGEGEGVEVVSVLCIQCLGVCGLQRGI